MVASVAVFNQKKTKEPLVDVPSRENSNVFGAYSATIWRQALQPIIQSRSWAFPPEDPEVVRGDSVAVPSVIGLDPAAATGVLQASGFPVVIAGERRDSPYPANFVAEQSPINRATRGQTVYLYLSSGRPPAARPGPGQGGGLQPGQPRPGRRGSPRPPRRPRPPPGTR